MHLVRVAELVERGAGVQYRRRTCSNPPASSGGKSCKGPLHQSNACNTHACAVKSVWNPKTQHLETLRF